jgi:hypothetical protein
MAGMACLVIGLLCALISRGLLVAAAFSISRWWGIGVLLPFGPLLFRLSYPEQAARARLLGLISLPCYLGFFAFGSGLSALSFDRDAIEEDLVTTSKAAGYASETAASSQAAAPSPAASPDARRAANEVEFARLRAWNERLVAAKRDILQSDVEGTRRYNVEAAQFNVALAAANAEKTALDSAH